MNCSKCGSPVANDATFCLRCGSSIQAPGAYPNAGYGQPAQPAYGQPAQPAYGQPAQPAYGQPAAGYGRPTRPAAGYGRPTARPARRTLEGVPMNLYNVMVNWLLFALAGLCVFIGIFYLARWNFASGIRTAMTDGDAFTGVLAMNIIFGILMILVGLVWVGCRFLLMNYSPNAPKMTCTMFLVTGGVVLLYRILAWSILASEMSDGLMGLKIVSAYDGIMVGLLFFLLCAIVYYVVGLYFRRRASLFR